MSAVPTDQIVHLTCEFVSLIFSVEGGKVSVQYWGKSLKPQSNDSLISLRDQDFNFNDLDKPKSAGIWRENSMGWPGNVSVQGHHQGRNFSTNFVLSNLTQTENSATFSAIDEASQLLASMKFELSNSGIVLVTNEITNLNQAPYSLNSLSTWLPIPGRAKEVISFTGRWVKERQIQREKIAVGNFARESRDGRSGHDATILMLAVTPNCDFQSGEAWTCGLAWSGNTRHQVEKLATGMQTIGAEELLLPGEIILEQNQTYTSPSVVFGYSDQGIDGISNQHYKYLREREIHPTNLKPRPLTLNIWEAVYFDQNLAKLTQLAETAKSIGVERFVLDDGWFNLRRDDHAGLGDWWVDERVWPNGLHELIATVKENGMEFGLWFEPEMVNPDSELYRNHPDWILRVSDRTPPEHRHQLVLNLANQEVYQYLFEKIDALLNKYSIDYIKWDHNRVLIEPGYHNRASVSEQTKQFYRLVDALKAAHPGLEIESCASGGARIDLGAVMHVDRFWTSDCNEALERNYIQRWTGIAIPPELLGTHIGPPKSHTTGRTHNLPFRAITALFGHAGIEWDITKANDEEKAHLRNWANYYKMNRDFLHSGNVVRITQPDDSIWVQGVINQDKTKAIFSVAHLAAVGSSKPPLLQLAGLDSSFSYKVSLVQPAGPAETIQNLTPSWATGAVISGEILLNHGLRGEKIQPENAYLIELNRIN